MVKALMNLFFSAPATNITNSIGGVLKEDPKVAKLREEAKTKMVEWGRTPLLKGGQFSRTNHVVESGRSMRMLNS